MASRRTITASVETGPTHRRGAAARLLPFVSALALAACAGISTLPLTGVPATSGTEVAGTSLGGTSIGGASLTASDAARQILVTLEQEPSWRLPRAGTSARGYGGEYRTSARTRRVAAALARDYGLREVTSWPIAALGVHCVVFEVGGESSTEEMLGRLERDERVESAQPMQVFSTQSEAAAYNDPYLELQHGVKAMQVELAHRWAQGAGVRVALVDTGVDVAHPELEERVVVTRDFVADERRVPPDRHGTEVAGIIASAANNGIGIVGVAPEAELLALRGCWPESAESDAGVCNSFTLAKALAFAVERRPDIINLSLAGPADPLLARLVGAALARGIVVVAAASDRPEESFPLDVPGVLGVRAAAATDAPVEAGARSDGALAAPGVDVITTVPQAGFDFVSGSSAAAAHVAGLAALLLERRPALSPAELAALLAEASRGAAPAGGAFAALDACAALARVDRAVRCPPPTAATVPAAP